MTTEAVQSARRAGTKQISARDRLSALPALLRANDLTFHFGWTPKQATHYLWLWRERGLLRSLGGHTNVFANCVKEPTPNWEGAILMARPSALLVGFECLRRAGWITQVKHRPEVAIDIQKGIGGLFDCEPFEIQARSSSWFERVRAARGIQLGQGGGHGAERELATLPSLKPAFALAEMLQNGGWSNVEGSGLGPDDIDWSMINVKDRADWKRALRVFDVDPVLDHVDDLYRRRQTVDRWASQ